jgi:hypothetical protein
MCVCVRVCVYVRAYIQSILWGFTHEFHGFRKHIYWIYGKSEK